MNQFPENLLLTIIGELYVKYRLMQDAIPKSEADDAETERSSTKAPKAGKGQRRKPKS